MVKENVKRNELTEAIIENGQNIQRLSESQIKLKEARMYYRIRVYRTEQLQGKIDAGWAKNNTLVSQYADNEESLAQ